MCRWIGGAFAHCCFAGVAPAQLFDYGSGIALGWVSERVINDLRLDVLRKFNSCPWISIARPPRSLTRINSDTKAALLPEDRHCGHRSESVTAVE
jgi:hypothetical protein